MPAKNQIRPVHPGETLHDELDELGMSASTFAEVLAVPTDLVTAILRGERGIHCRHGATLVALSRHDTAAMAEPPADQTFELRVSGGSTRDLS